MSTKPTQAFSLSALLRLTRFWNLIIIAAAQFCAAGFLLGHAPWRDYRLMLLAASTGLIAAAGYVINDYYDIKIDLINKPDRVVIGKSITRRYAILFHSLLSFLGVGIGFLLGWKVGAIHFLSSVLLWWYSNNLKRQPFIGNLAVALLTGFSIAMVNVLYGVNNPLVTIYATFAFFMTLVREIIKDMEDLRGDNTFGCRTLPIIWGIRRTKVLVYLLLAFFAVLVYLLNESRMGIPAYYYFAFLFLPLGLVVGTLVRADTVRDYYRLSLFCKLIMLLGILSMALV